MVALIQPLAQELLYASGLALKRQKKKKKKKKKKKYMNIHSNFIYNSQMWLSINRWKNKCGISVQWNITQPQKGMKPCTCYNVDET